LTSEESTKRYIRFVGDSQPKMNGLKRAAAAEAYGTFLLTMLGPGTITAMAYVGFSSSASLGFIGLAHGVVLIVAFYSIGHVSGAHINPAVTIAAWATRRVERRRVLPYLIAQLFGATVAGFVLLALWSSSTATLRVCCNGFNPTYLGDTLPGSEFGVVAALVAEVIGTAILIFTIFGATDKKANQSFAGLAIGLVLAAVIWMFGPISGASLNPARTWGPTIASSVFSLTPLANLWIYIVGPVLGGLLGAFLYDVIRPEQT
jgi:glycerol uptake facilitator